MIDAAIVIDPDGAFLCFVDAEEFRFPIEPCPEGSPSVDDVEADADGRRVEFGPVIARRIDAGFENVQALGGSAGMRLDG